MLTTAAIALVLAVLWAGSDLVRSIGGAEPQHARYEFTGITKQTRFSFGKTAITIAALLVALQWPLHMNAGIQSILTTQVAIYVLLAIGLNVVVVSLASSTSATSPSGRSVLT